MSKGNTFEDDMLKLIFNASAIADLAENDASSPATTLTVALHTADPGEGGTQTTNETAYTGYARVAVARTTGGWTVSGEKREPGGEYRLRGVHGVARRGHHPFRRQIGVLLRVADEN